MIIISSSYMKKNMNTLNLLVTVASLAIILQSADSNPTPLKLRLAKVSPHKVNFLHCFLMWNSRAEQ